jgi:hypothetical protein
MKTTEINPLNMYAAPARVGAFDPVKFARLIRQKDRKTWWRRFMESVEQRRADIIRELHQYRLAHKSKD